MAFGFSFVFLLFLFQVEVLSQQQHFPSSSVRLEFPSPCRFAVDVQLGELKCRSTSQYVAASRA